MSAEHLERNKHKVIACYDLMFNQCKPAAAIERYARASFTQYNPHVADAKQAFIDYFQYMAQDYPDERVDFKRAVAEGDLVVPHCHQHWPTEPEKNFAGIDISRFDPDGKVVEHWDVLQIVAGQSANPNSMF